RRLPPRRVAAVQVLARLVGPAEAHPLQDAAEVGGCLPGEDAIDHVLVLGEALGLLLEDPPARLRAEEVLAAPVLERARRVLPRAHERGRELAHVAERRQRVRQRRGLALRLPRVLDAVPDGAVRVAPGGVLLAQPLPLLGT